MKGLVVFLLISCYSEEGAAAAHSIKIETSSLCSNNKRLPGTFLTLNSFNTKGKLSLYAEIDVKETFKGPISLQMDPQRCNEDLSQCSQYPPVKRDNICNDFNTTFFGPDFLSRIHPPLKCPIKSGKYIFNHTVTDFTNMRKGNVITGKYKSKMMAFGTKNGERRQILCWNMIIRVSGVSSRKN